MPSHLRERAEREGMVMPAQERPVFKIPTKYPQQVRTPADIGTRGGAAGAGLTAIGGRGRSPET